MHANFTHDSSDYLNVPGLGVESPIHITAVPETLPGPITFALGQRLEV